MVTEGIKQVTPYDKTPPRRGFFMAAFIMAHHLLLIPHKVNNRYHRISVNYNRSFQPGRF